jgi:sulfur-carrier protein
MSAAQADWPRVTVTVPTPLRHYCGGAGDLTVTASSIRGVLDELERRHPRLYVNLCDETGAVRRHLNVFVNASHMRDCRGLDTSLAAGDVVTILTAVSGG